MDGVAIFSGQIASQPLAFAHLLDVSDAEGLSLDFDHVEVIAGGDPSARLIHALGAAAAAEIIARHTGQETLILIFPEALIPGARLFKDTPLLKRIGTYPAARPRTRT